MTMKLNAGKGIQSAGGITTPRGVGERNVSQLSQDGRGGHNREGPAPFADATGADPSNEKNIMNWQQQDKR